MGTSEGKEPDEYMNILSQHWKRIKELVSRLETLLHGMHRSLYTIETIFGDSLDIVLFATLPLSQLVKYVRPVNEAFFKELSCKQQIISSFWNYSSRDILTMLITIWWRQPFIDPVEFDFYVGAVGAELAVDEYQTLQEDKEATSPTLSTTSSCSNSEIVSYLLL